MSGQRAGTALFALVMLAGCASVNHTRAPSRSDAVGFNDPASWGRGVIESFRDNNQQTFMTLVVSEDTFGAIIEASEAPEGAKAQMRSEMPRMVARRRAELAERFAQIVDEGRRRAIPWEHARFQGARVLAERVQSGTMTRDIALRVTLGDITHTLIATQCVSIPGGPISLLGDLSTSEALADVRSADVHAMVMAAITAAMYYDYEHGRFPPHIDALAELLEGGMAALTDPWGSAFVISSQGPHVRICSSGADRRAGSADDICEGRTR